MRKTIFGTLLIINTVSIALVFFVSSLWPLVLITLLLLGLAIYDSQQRKHAILRNFPLLGRARWLIESMRPFIQQYILETDTGGAPISRMFRNIAYQRAKNSRDTIPFGTQVDTYQSGYEWIGHSLSALNVNDIDASPRVTIGSKHCKQPYSASILNISAMSFGSLSKPALLALNKGAKLGGFYHNTGEGGVSPYHLEHGADVVWQIGTGYFGCRDEHGNFDADKFTQQASHPNIKMIEIKLSQGAKPGHGGILPANKNTQEIADIRGVKVGTQVDSPPSHSAFKTPLELIQFIQQLRELSGYKPVGIKLALGRRSEFMAICKAMVELNITPDFITVDGGEGGTGAAPLEYSNSIGSPLREALAFVDDCLVGFGLREDIKIIASGKIISGFHLVKNLALGADICNSARGMMLALGCVQSLSCNTNECPTGVATQDPSLYAGLVPENKAVRVFQFHKKTVHATSDIVSSAGLASPCELNRTHIFRRVNQQSVKRYDELFEHMQIGGFLSGDIATKYQIDFDEASAHSFAPAKTLTTINQETKSLCDNNA
ncbi:FMN-binding glutamate synthase family protein [Glaciecola sp. MH2013]|uniref:FMN-binding glutamate synthase family protein n=1 Tax=Glaciecola sp. MH2013 TaxID=2785524 RepID=UPI00189D64BB|nr:FMN-binding glutamate synthase family protein [Glaciecola sp. MH2013]MBF7073859.1 FMN-binding glutamate synthase family protein [Glaciecola sp. MH2013]